MGRLVCVFPGATVRLRPTAPAQSRRPAVGDAGVSERPTGGCGVSPRGAAAPLGGLGGRRLSGRPPPAHGLGGGERGGGRGLGGGSLLSPPRPPGAAPRRPRGGSLVIPVPGGQPLTGGGVLFPRPHSALWCRALAQALARVPSSPRCRRAEPAGWGGGRKGRCVLGAVVRVSGQQLAGCGAVHLLSRSVPPSSLPLEVARAPLPHCTVGGGVGQGARLRWGDRPAALFPVPPTRPSPGPMGRGRHRRRRSCGGWGCGGGGFRRR